MVCRGNKTVKRISPPGLGLSLETVQAFGLGSELGRQDLEGDIALETGIVGAVDLPHPPGPEGREDLVGAEACSGRQPRGHPPGSDATRSSLPLPAPHRQGNDQWIHAEVPK
jgi:hypothetical protein